MLSIAVVLRIYAEVYTIWYAEYHLGVPTEAELAARPANGHLCVDEAGTPYVPLADMPLHLRQTAIASNGADFLTRPNLMLPAMLAALVKGDGRRPDSRITFQVTRNCLHVLAPECCRGLDWHVGSLVFMGRLERTLSRERILESYLNDTYLGRGTVGVAAAAGAYFDKSLADLKVEDIAFLIARFRYPPYRRLEHSGRDVIIDRMLSAGFIDQAQAAAAKAAPLPAIDRQPRHP
ncbi:transglycosylase domain-containing protein [Bradyrhizobium ontarionense]|uniref:Transglycosylase domain-containing protein n=1 Tax=Bradyrhizobium ontarionense TaxID=2898149 RepID=A0ABY3RIZ8_9BRAD|nr:transglycosylase domain-containing protein [Bradyrhizobium sp. A19]UFZ06867.1 transglycosylase domain-containing protein [Bradyrhizobium sp. A19]